MSSSAKSPYAIPIPYDDYERSSQLAHWLADKRWTVGEAKMAFAVWFEQAGCPPEYGIDVLGSETIAFVRAVAEMRGYRDSDEGRRFPNKEKVGG